VKKFIHYLLLIIFFLFITRQITAQENYVQISNQGIYLFLDELASEQFVELNSCVKPYSRNFIAKKLYEAKKDENKMSRRMKNKLHFYLLDYGKENDDFLGSDFYLSKFFNFKNQTQKKKKIDMFYYGDSSFQITINPIISFNYNITNNTNIYKRSNGAEAYANFGKHWGFYVSLRDNYFSEDINNSNFLIPDQGIVQSKKSDGSIEGEQIHAGVSYSWDWGSIGIIKDHINWGDNYHGANIISDRAPSFARINLNLKPTKWFELNYFHAWLVSNIVDSSRSWQLNYGMRKVMYEKYMAANMITFKPFKNFHISAGNSIIYSDIGIHPVYLIPVMFFKAADESINGNSNYIGQNAQMFFNISSRQIKHLHIYSSLFIDEISLSRMWDDSLQSNFISWKFGTKLSNLIPNASICFEYTRTNPITYKHFIPTTTFASNDYNLGSYLKDNVQELYININYQPHFRWNINASLTFIQKGPDYEDDRKNQNVLGLPFIDYIQWSYNAFELKTSYTIMHNTFFSLGVRYTNVSENNIGIYTPAYISGKQWNVFGGLRLGF